MRARTTETVIAYAESGRWHAEDWACQPCPGQCSLDLTDEEAGSLLAGAGPQHGLDAETLLGFNPAAAFRHPAAVEEILSSIDGRFLAGASDERERFAAAAAGRLLLARLKAAAVPPRPDAEAIVERFASGLHDWMVVQGGGREVAGRPCGMFVCALTPGVLAAILAERERVDGSWTLDALLDLMKRDAEGAAGWPRPDLTAAYFREHEHAWGRRHRLVRMACEAGVPEKATENSPDRHGTVGSMPRTREWHREAWRSGGSVVRRVLATSPALQLARIVASAAAASAACPGHADLGAVKGILERNYLGDGSLSPHIDEAWQTGSYHRLERRTNRDMAGLFDMDKEGRLNDMLRLAARMRSCDTLPQRRDRLLVKMMGRGVPVATLLGLRIDGLEVDGCDDIHDISGPAGDPVRLCPMDDCDDTHDFWALVRANERLDGFLFAAIDDGMPYGRRRLSFDDVGEIRRARMLEVGLEPVGGTPCVHEPEAILESTA